MQKSIFLILLASSLVFGFTFDSLSSGITSQEAERIMKAKKTSFRKSINHNYTYSTEIAGSKAFVVAFFGERNILYKLRIRFNSKEDVFYRGLAEMLSSKYKRSRRMEDTPLNITLSNSMAWRDKQNIITLEKNIFKLIHLQYTDSQLAKLEKSFAKKKMRGRQDRLIKKDTNRF